MNRPLILSRLQQLTGKLKSAPGTSRDVLTKLQRRLTKHLIQNPAFNVSGNRMPHEIVEETERAADLTEQFSHLSDLFDDKRPAKQAEAAPLVFRRETAFHSNLLGNSVPDWANGMAVSESLGPFIDEHGVQVWFDFYLAAHLVGVYIKGNSSPSLLIPLSGTVWAGNSYSLAAGSVWIASNLITKTSALNGYFTGLKIKGGSLELSSDSTVDLSNQIIIHPDIIATLNLELDQNTFSTQAVEAGLDAGEAAVKLPQNLELRFDSNNSILTASAASCTVFGCDAEFEFENTAPSWLAPLNSILVLYSVSVGPDATDIFQINSSDSSICNFSKSARIDQDFSGWLLPATKLEPSQLGEASGTGALCISLSQGVNANWKGLKGGSTKLFHPGIIAEPGQVTVLDFYAENLQGRQKWVLWRNRSGEHNSEITLGFGKAFPFIFISSAQNAEILYFFCNHKASFDRPVDANGKPFKIESAIAFAGILQNGPESRAFLLDTDLLFDGNYNNPDAFTRHSIILRNALFNVSRPYSLFVYGVLENDNQITEGVVALMFGVYLYLPTLPDPYVASYTSALRSDFKGRQNRVTCILGGFVKWHEGAQVDLVEREREGTDTRAYVYFKLALTDQTLAFASHVIGEDDFGAIHRAERMAALISERRAAANFRNGVRTFSRELASDINTNITLPLPSSDQPAQGNIFQPAEDAGVQERVRNSLNSGGMQSVISDLEASPMLAHIEDMTTQVDQTLSAALKNTERGFAGANFSAIGARADNISATNQGRGRPDIEPFLIMDAFTLLDVSSNADQMGVSLGAALRVERDQRGDTNIVNVNALENAAAATGADLQLQILNMDVVTKAENLRAVTLPQVSWEPIWNIPLAIEGKVDLADLVTVAPGLLVYENDGIPTRIFSESPYHVPVTPLSVTKHFLKEFHDKQVPRRLRSVFTLPFALIGQADYNRKAKGPAKDNAQVDFHMPHFDELRGGLQLKTQAPASPSPKRTNSFAGWTIQLDNIKWFIASVPITGSTLGNTVQGIFNNKFFYQPTRQVPVEKMEISGYGASIFSNWLDEGATIADVSQVKFDVLVGRTAHEVVQVRSILYPFGVHVVRTITLMRAANGYVFRSDSGWKAESDGFYDFDYTVNLNSPVEVDDPYEFHTQPIKGVSNVREIKDYPEGSPFISSFKLNDPELPPEILAMTLAQWQELFDVKSLNDKLPVKMQAVVFDADVHLDNVTSGGAKDPAYGDFKVQSRKMLGYVQLAPTAVLVPAHTFAELLNFQNGSLGGPVDCIIDIAGSNQRMRLSRVDVNPAFDKADRTIFATAARGSLILPPDGSWSVVKQTTNTGDVKPVEEGQSVPLIKANGDPNFKIANPTDVVQLNKSLTNFGVLQSTGTQKLLFDIPQFTSGQKKLMSGETYFADAYKLLNSKGVFPNVANALALTDAEKEVEIVGEGLMKMAERDIDLNSLLPSDYQYVFIDEPDILKVYARYKSTGNAGGNLKLGIDSTAALADKWKAALSNIRVIVDLGPFTELLWVDGNFNASSGLDAKYDKPKLQFGPVLQPVVDILQILATLTGNDFDKGMNVGMSNSADNWEYKFNCSKEIPVIKFPSPEQLTLNPNPPLKLEAGLTVGFYFNEVLSIPTDLKQLVPACGAFVNFHGGLEVMCFSLAAASIYAVGQVDLGIAADTKAGISLHMKFGFGVEVVVGLPVVGNVSVLYMVEITVGISQAAVDVGAMMLFRGSAEICGGLVGVCIQIEAGGSIHRDLVAERTDCIAQVTFSIDITILWVIDIDFSDSWQESRQIA
jgi:hypothetical protein